MSKADIKGLVAAFIVAVVVFLAVMGFAGAVGGKSSTPTPTYCGPEEGVPMCPPPVGETVIAEWSESIATARWTGRDWVLVVPGHIQVLKVYPNSWRYPDEPSP